MSKIVTIIGDTSRFHQGSRMNYTQFRKLISEKYDIIQEIPYDAFGVEYIEYQSFMSRLMKSEWWKGLEESNILVVHGEGLTEKQENFTYHLIFFSWIAKHMGIESWLVNFSMFEAAPFLPYLREFTYIACREGLTFYHLAFLGLKPELSFDCSLLGLPISPYSPDDGSVAVIRGRHLPNKESLHDFRHPVKYNCCWEWEDEAVSLPTINNYTERISNSNLTLSTSFHGNIISYLSGIPFISLNKTNPKYSALDIELLPHDLEIPLRNILGPGVRRRIHDYFTSILDDLRARARLNCI